MSASAVVSVLGDADVLSVDVSFPPTLLVGQRLKCFANVRVRTGERAGVDPAWSSSNPDVVSVDSLGNIIARSGGQADISASFRGKLGAAPGNANKPGTES